MCHVCSCMFLLAEKSNKKADEIERFLKDFLWNKM